MLHFIGTGMKIPVNRTVNIIYMHIFRKLPVLSYIQKSSQSNTQEEEERTETYKWFIFLKTTPEPV